MAKQRRNPKSSNTDRVRIIGGMWRSRVIAVAPVEGVRPTPNRVRETVFNWLQPYIEGAECLDLYAGSGALGIEAASRGAKQVVLVDDNSEVIDTLREQVQTLKADQIDVFQSDADQYIQNSIRPFDILFIDPPFFETDFEKLLNDLSNSKLLKPQSIVYLEFPVEKAEMELPTGWEWLKHKEAGQVGYGLLKGIIVL